MKISVANVAFVTVPQSIEIDAEDNTVYGIDTIVEYFKNYNSPEIDTFIKDVVNKVRKEGSDIKTIILIDA